MTATPWRPRALPAVLAALLAILAPALVAAQTATVKTDVITTNGQRVELTNPDRKSYGVATIEVSGTYTGTTSFQVLGTTRSNVSCSVASSTSTATGTTSGQTGKWVCPVSGWQAVSVVGTSAMTGTATVRISYGPGGGAGGGGGGGGSFDGVLKDSVGDSAMDDVNNAARVNVVAGGTSGPTDTDDGSIATGQSPGLSASLLQAFDGTVWRRVTFGTAGTASAQVTTVQGIASMTPLLVTLSGTNNLNNIAGTISLPTGASTAANQTTGNTSVGNIDTDLGTAAAPADALAQPTIGFLQSLPSLFNGSTWDRFRSVVNGQNTTGTGIAAAGILCQLDDTSTGAVTENQFAPVRCSTRRSLLVEGVSGGTAIGIDSELPAASAAADGAANPTAPFVVAANALWNGTTWDRAPGSAANGATVNTEMPAAAALANGTSNPTVPGVAGFMMVYNGSTWDRMTVPTSACDDPSKVTQVNVSMTAATGAIEIVALTSSQIVYVCGYDLFAGGDTDVTAVYGTGTNCGTGTTTIATVLSTSTTIGYGVSKSNGGAVQFKNIASNALCLSRSASVTLKGYVTYVKQ